MKLVGFGASTMSGTGDSQGGFFARVCQKLAQQKLPVEGVQFGIGGDTTRKMLARAGSILSVGKHDLIIMLGCNDLPRRDDKWPDTRTTIQEYERNLCALLTQIRGERSLFVSSFPVDPQKTGVSAEMLTDYMSLAISLAQGRDYQIWDMHKELLTVDLTNMWSPDGLHFNDQGHAFIAQGILSRIQNWYA